MHAKQELSDCAKLLVLKLFDDRNNYPFTEILLKAQGWYPSDVGFDEISLFGGLHCASIFGIEEIVASLVEVEGYNINQSDCMGNTALMWAAQNRHEGVVKILLGRGDISPNKPNHCGRTPLRCAVSSGHGGVVKFLLGREDINFNELDHYGHSSLAGCCKWERGNGANIART